MKTKLRPDKVGLWKERDGTIAFVGVLKTIMIEPGLRNVIAYDNTADIPKGEWLPFENPTFPREPEPPALVYACKVGFGLPQWWTVDLDLELAWPPRSAQETHLGNLIVYPNKKNDERAVTAIRNARAGEE